MSTTTDRIQREHLRRAGVSHIDERIRMGQTVDRRDMTVVASTSHVEHAGLREDQIFVWTVADPDTGEDTYEVHSWDGAEAHHLSGPHADLDEAAGAWLEAVRA